LEDYLLKRDLMVHLQPFKIEPPKYTGPLDVFEAAYKMECEFRDHLEALTKLARAEDDELTTAFICGMLDDQVTSCNDFEVLVNKARAYSQIQGLFYHLDHELGHKSKK